MDKDVREALDDLKQRINELDEKIKGATVSTRELGSAIGSSSNLIADASKRMLALGKDSVNFAKSIERQYKAAEKFAIAYKEVSINAGISYTKQQEFGKSFIASSELAFRLGADIGDVKNAYSSLADASGKARIFSPEEIENVIALEKSTGLMGDSAAKLAERMDFMGKSAEQTQEHIGQLMIDSQKLGLNASKVVKVLSDNFSEMQNMSFRGGVKGMSEMAKFAVKMRGNVSEMLGMAEKFYEPEAAIEAVANLQMLGGDVADAFGDPFEIMYLARNKPEELAKKLQDMTENMMTFNEKTGEYEFPPEARMQLKSAGEQLGINTDTMIDMARQASKIKDIKMNVSGNIVDEDMREGIAGMARMKDGKWVVDINGEEIAIDSAKMSEDMAKELLSAPTTTDDAIMITAKEAMTSNKYLDQLANANEAKILKDVNVFMGFEDTIKKPMDEFTKEMGKTTDTLITALSETGMGDKMNSMFENAGMKAETFVGNIMGGINTVLAENLGLIENIEIANATVELQNLIRGPKSDVTGLPEGGKGDVTTKNIEIANATVEMKNLLKESKPDVTGLPVGKDDVTYDVSKAIKIEPITLTINGDLSLKTSKGSEKIDVDSESLRRQVTEMINNALNGTSFNGGKPGQSLNTSR